MDQNNINLILYEVDRLDKLTANKLSKKITKDLSETELNSVSKLTIFLKKYFTLSRNLAGRVLDFELVEAKNNKYIFNVTSVRTKKVDGYNCAIVYTTNEDNTLNILKFKIYNTKTPLSRSFSMEVD